MWKYGRKCIFCVRERRKHFRELFYNFPRIRNFKPLTDDIFLGVRDTTGVWFHYGYVIVIITQEIQNIHGWFVKYVKYFKDKRTALFLHSKRVKHLT